MNIQKGMAFSEVAGGKGRPFVKGDPRINRAGRASSQPVRTLKKDVQTKLVPLLAAAIPMLEVGVKAGDPASVTAACHLASLFKIDANLPD